MFAKTRLALMIGITGGMNVSVLAQETSTTHDTVVVTSQMQSGATKLETPDIETPQAVSIVTRQQYEEQGATSVRQAVSYTPGVYSNQIGASNRFDYIVLRGFSDGSLDNVYLDGLKLMGDTNSHSSLVIDPWFLDSVEVVRGPASVLYGRSSPGGIVALNSRKPSFDPGGEVKLFAGNNNQRGAAFDVTGPVDDNDRVAVRLTGMTRYADSQFDHLKEQRYAIAPSLTWRITDQTRLELMAYLHRDPEGGSHSGLPYEGTVTPHAGRKISNTFFEGEDDYDKYDRRENMVGYNIEHAFDSGWSVRQKLRYLHTKVNLNQVYAAGWLNDTELNRGYSGSDESLSAITLDNQIDGSVDTGIINHRLLFGVDYQRRSNNVTASYGSFPAIDAFNPVYGADPLSISVYSREKHKLEQTGIYLQDQMSLDRWRLTLGGRHDQVKITNVNKINDTRDTLDQDHFSSRAALMYLFDNGFAPYVSYSTAFTPTSFTDEYGKILQPMKGKQWEAGLKFQPEGSQTMYSASVYRINQKNIATKVEPTDPYRSIGEIESEGVELEAVGQLTDNLRLQAAYTYNDIRYKKSSAEEQGKRAVYAPRNQASAWLSYDVKTGLFNGLTVGSGVRYVNGITSDRQNTHTLPSYTLVDLAVGYDLGNVGLKGMSAQLNVNNLTDKRYVAACNSLSYCYFGAERSVVGSVSWAF
ncbi:UNVERIFIED_ORG: iron complex outermembrane receptor protein [Kosakonia oryzae]|uniref:Iron complex outermembrane recepter protein n=1 Tax=Kosakonia radicincitans TaxID=283686 RepID=A0AAX2ESA1_9ENTR|nr:ferrioxamine B receptor FoxA [Kosakonia radicincitans]MDP9566457.1 iron complex outermembrane receptor protein [Kosakonia oryzae]SFE54631.1 iron complex outermembrane recepter protein [Kosakonia radicincitans]SFR13796.1 iron complex outermembrane recepter protein [Kosakonia radicincitans]SFU11087.1 iron complex outermembrane recepter protein [Kosakonia radicincitans]SFY17340.1 iron complex outermembrane recepter protein [Kosakonia radicincitans]